MSESTGPHDAPPKAVLFCPSCGHRSRPDGDWTVHEGTTAAEFTCPDCGTVVEERPLVGPSAERSLLSPVSRAIDVAFRTARAPIRLL